jgi:cobalt-zinc-cadmium efflux system protein
MLSVALAGVCVNLAASWMIARSRGAGTRRSLNVEGAFAHILTDLYAFAATAVAAVVVLATGFDRADPIATLVVVGLMLRAGAGLIRASGRIFLEAAPIGLDLAALGAAMAAQPHVAEVHDLHVWEITAGLPAASAHVLVDPGEDCHAVRADLEALLARNEITHATLQVDHVPTAQGAEHAPDTADPAHCEDSHGPSYRPRVAAVRGGEHPRPLVTARAAATSTAARGVRRVR